MECFERSRKGLDRVGISRDTVHGLRVLRRHADKLRDALPPTASHVDFPIEGRTIVECYCALVPLLRQFKLSHDNVDEAFNLAKKVATSFWEICFLTFICANRNWSVSSGLYTPLTMLVLVHSFAKELKLSDTRSR